MAMGEADRPNPLSGTRQAASVVVLRDRDGGGVETLMLRRAQRAGDFRSGVAVFPGGALSASDRQAHAHVRGWTDAEASARLGVPQGGLDYVVAAARECFEEVGLLFATPVTPELLARAHNEWRSGLQRGEHDISALCAALGLSLDGTDWGYISHWVTPIGLPKRFDTRFFVARAPAGQEAVADAQEAESILWITPKAALDPASGLMLLPVTQTLLRWVQQHDTVDAALAAARALPAVPMTLPRLVRSAPTGETSGTIQSTAGTPGVVLPGDGAYDEVGWLDPEGRGDAWGTLVPGRVVRLSPRILRVTAPNPGVMTGAGTNSYLVGDPTVNRWTLIDPGPNDPAHRGALLAAAPGPIDRILLTHTHLDHADGAAALAEATGAPVCGRRPPQIGPDDTPFAPDHELFGGERLELGPGVTLEVLHTPGHAANHLAFQLAADRLLFVGDHLMQGGTVVIAPPDGDMTDYLASLDHVATLDIDWLAPGHGFLMAHPAAVAQGVRRHRLLREARILDALRTLGPITEDALLAAVYADTPVALHPVARWSLQAHLTRLMRNGLVHEHDARYVIVA
ncbi:MAG: MBL fold metallo-hydrolase [Gemmatimonadaceae bacterium]